MLVRVRGKKQAGTAGRGTACGKVVGKRCRPRDGPGAGGRVWEESRPSPARPLRAAIPPGARRERPGRRHGADTCRLLRAAGGSHRAGTEPPARRTAGRGRGLRFPNGGFAMKGVPCGVSPAEPSHEAPPARERPPVSLFQEQRPQEHGDKGFPHARPPPGRGHDPAPVTSPLPQILRAADTPLARPSRPPAKAHPLPSRNSCRRSRP